MNNLNLRECFVTNFGMCYFHCWGSHTTGETKAIVENQETGNVIMVYPEEVHFKLPPSVLETIRRKEIEKMQGEDNKYGN